MYASRTGTRRNLAEMRKYGFRLLVSATGCHRSEGFPYALDNGAWTAFQSGSPWDEAAFTKLVSSMGAGADWVVVPDVVGNPTATISQTRKWLPYCLSHCRRALVAVQDGMSPNDVEPFLSDWRVGIAIGGTTDWKRAQLASRAWADSLPRGAWLHCLRVNTHRRIRLASAAGCHSFDGTSVTRFAVNAKPIAEVTKAAAQQQEMF